MSEPMDTIPLEPPLRRATPADDRELAELIDMAGEGLPSYLWESLAEPGESIWDVGRSQARREEGGFSYRNAVMVEHAGSVVATLVDYRLPDAPEPVDRGALPPAVVPLVELERQVPETWYVNALAGYPRHRGQGHGTLLLGVAERLARASASAGVSLIVADTNAGARRLYERHGYREVATRPVVHGGWSCDARHWVLMAK